MSLQLRVLDPGDCSVIEGETRICTGPAFTIGRGPDNDWVLLDAQRHLSKHHCRIERSETGYLIVDTSTNGVYVGDSSAPVGRGNSHPLANGDILNLSTCVVRIEISGELAASAAPRTLIVEPPPPAATGETIIAPSFFGASASRFAWSKPTVSDEKPAAAPFEPITGFPGAGIGTDAAPGDTAGTPMALAGPSDNPAVTETFFRAPEILRPAVPVDWHKEAADRLPVEPQPLAAPVETPASDEAAVSHRIIEADVIDLPVVSPRVKTAPVLSPPPPPAPAPHTVTPHTPTPHTLAQARPPAAAPSAEMPADAQRLIEAFLDGAALPIDAFDMTDPAATLRKIGQAFREAVGGIRELLESRAMLKAEFRLEHTLVRARDNNPLKFSNNLDGTLAVLLGRRVPGFMEPPEAIRESVRDVKAHEIAMMAGLRAALTAQLEQLAPAQIRAQAEKGGGHALLPQTRKARLWDRYEELHEDMSTEQVTGSPVGRGFAEAYSRQFRKL
ncbi:phosphopeptide-binding protein [Aliidongia dinghuensis]|uniref:Phosphopeptide-binding protein n=1 Tax=Aliidongia dinghuensis TaxID=1867774 RepID=A0A8J3E3N2_9PROT|nr:type VI secretion system-associated FHA domain protein TagH [Aliidongia dinghuensis]GGF20346.1 phosphopeptide-binding protein [Aliidongia dinghuensis]